ncbi:hypothetical protein BH11PSE11_BH11PSE11_00150 [soil metagenome]
MNQQQKFAALIREEHDALLSEWRAKVRKLPAAKDLDKPTLNDHIPVLLEEIARALELSGDAQIDRQISSGSSPIHGLQRLENGYQIEEVVAEYNILRDCLHDLATRRGIALQGLPFHILSRALDGAIASAVQAFAAQQAFDIQRRREDYLAFVAHDLRTPLNAVALATETARLMLAQSLDIARMKKMLDVLQRNVGYLNALVSKVLDENTNLDTDGGIKLTLRRFDLWPLVESLVQDLHPVAGTGSTRLINKVPDDMLVCADAALLRRVLQNLIANAISYTPHGEVVVSALQTTDGVEIQVSDNGSGIPEDRMPHIFKKFETDGTAPSSLGLGLTICKSFVEAHGGSITVNSEMGRGSTFRFTLPDIMPGLPLEAADTVSDA